MKLKRFLAGLFVTGVLLCGGGALGFREDVNAATEFDFPDPIGYINDFAGVLSNDEVLGQRLREFDEAESTQVVVIVVDELPENVVLEEFVPLLTEQYPKWRAGQDEYDNGVIMTIVIDSREMRIDTGYGVEGALPDATAKLILDNEVRPYFRAGDYDSGVEAGVEGILDAVTGEYIAPETVDESDDSELLGMMFICCPFFLIFVLPWLGAFLGRTKSWWLGGVLGFIGGVIVAIIFNFVFEGIGRVLGYMCLPPLMTIFGLLFDFVLSKNYKVRKKKGMNTGFWSSWGGFSGGSSGGFSGGSSGGFSGGGGSFGGGGASSGW